MTMTPQQRINQIAGKAVLFIGAECNHWGLPQFASAAARAKALGFDTIAPRRAEGTVKYYRTPTQLMGEHAACHAQDVGYFPFAYCYGPRFGLPFVDKEVAVLLEMTEAMAEASGHEGYVCADLEIEYDGRGDAAARFRDAIQGKPGLLALTTWGNPVAHRWHNVIANLLPVVNMWIPQEYDDFLAIQSNDAMINVAPAIDLSQEFGSNHPASITAQYKAHGAQSFWVWEYQFIGSQATLARQITRIAKG